MMAGLSKPSMVSLNSPRIGHHPDWQSERHRGNTICTEICAHEICRKFGGRTSLGRFLSKADVQETRINTGKKNGRPGRTRTSDLFRVNSLTNKKPSDTE